MVRQGASSSPVVVGGVDGAGIETSDLGLFVLVRCFCEGFCTDAGAGVVVVVAFPVPWQCVGEG